VAVGALVAIVILLLLTTLGPVVYRVDPALIHREHIGAPAAVDFSFPFPLGTDAQGRDMLARLLAGARISLAVGFVSALINLIIGIGVGLLAGWANSTEKRLGGAIDMIIMRGMDILLAFPSLLLALALMTVFEANLRNAVIAIGLVYVPRFARVIRSSTLQTRDAEFVQASLVTGATTPRLLFRHILPNTLSPILVLATLSLSGAILEIAALSFLGLGATDVPEWGNMLTDAKKYISVHPSMMFYPGLALALSVFGINLLGDGLRDALDVRLKSA
jgi:peptide/nickel transport system permease protein